MRYDLGRCYLQDIFKQLGMNISNQEFADKMGMSKQQASDTLRGITKMNTALFLSVCATYDIDPMKVYELIPRKKVISRKQQPRTKSTD